MIFPPDIVLGTSWEEKAGRLHLSIELSVCVCVYWIECVCVHTHMYIHMYTHIYIYAIQNTHTKLFIKRTKSVNDTFVQKLENKQICKIILNCLDILSVTSIFGGPES